MSSFGWEAIKQPRLSETNCREKPPERLALKTDETHVWLVSLDVADAEINSLKWLVSADEREKAERFRFLRDKKEYLATKVYLRFITSKYLNCSPRLLTFKQNEYGKPYLTNEAGELKLSISHSRGYALLALARRKEVGIDLESFDSPGWFDEETALRSLTKTELKQFFSLPAGERAAFFYRCWTRKEAYSKAIGKGFMIEPNQIETTYSPAKNNETNSAGWTFYDLPLIDSFESALVVEGNRQINLRFFKL